MPSRIEDHALRLHGDAGIELRPRGCHRAARSLHALPIGDDFDEARPWRSRLVRAAAFVGAFRPREAERAPGGFLA